MVLRLPCDKTIRKRILQIDPLLAVESREGKQMARQKFGLNQGKLECGAWPWDIIHIDEALLNIFPIDPNDGSHLDRPHITLAIDTFSRTILGFILSVNTPDSATLALTFGMAMFSKERWLTKWDMNGREEDLYPIWGRPGMVVFDNAFIHEAKAVVRGCENNHISYEFRNLKDPQNGAFIESFIGTLKAEIATWPGGFTPDLKQREVYQPEKKACLPLPVIERMIAQFILRIYHQRLHTGIRDLPLNKYKEGLIASGMGIPDKIYGEDANRFILDFMPFKYRVVRKEGIELDGNRYIGPVLKRYIVQVEKEGRATRKRKFPITTNPNDISLAYLYDEDAKMYFEVPHEDLRFPSMSREEFRYVKILLKKHQVNVNTDNILKARQDINNIMANSIKRKSNLFKKVKRAQERSKDADLMITKKDMKKNVVPPQDLVPVKPFAEIKILTNPYGS